MPADTTTTTVGAPRIVQAGPPGQPNALERRAFAEGARTAAMLARQDEHALPPIEARDDPNAGLAFVLGASGATPVVPLHPDQGTVKARWLDRNTLQDVAAWAARLSAAGFNLYWTPNLPVAGLLRKPGKADMRALRALWADVDAKDGRTMSAAFAAVSALPMPPASFITATGGGFQPVWLFEAEIPATPDTVAQVERHGETLARLCGGDAVQNVDRILRLPFTMNYPNARKREAGRVPCPSGLVREPAR